METDQGALPEKIDYDFWTRCKAAPKPGEEPVIEFRIDRFRASAGGKTRRSGRVGAGTLNLEGAGLPDLLAANLVQPDFWYPLMTWYLPPELKGEAFDVSQALGSGAQFVGKGTLKNGEYSFSGKIADTQGAGPGVNLSWKVDGQGWLASGEGTVISSSGTVSFTIRAS